MNYSAQTSDIRHALFNVSALDELIGQGLYPDLSTDLIEAIVEEAGRFATDIIAPLNHEGDQIGARFENGQVKMPPHWAQAYQQWVEAGWGALPGIEEFGDAKICCVSTAGCKTRQTLLARCFNACFAAKRRLRPILAGVSRVENRGRARSRRCG